ncbi:MAG: hypothetical protein JJU02_00495 [Cryomorphaceae bacterium]|nr:hypothetical protein [Cryomorphaceae bacterium]
MRIQKSIDKEVFGRKGLFRADSPLKCSMDLFIALAAPQSTHKHLRIILR